MNMEQYRCRECDNVAWQHEVCHDELMEAVCYCGSGEFLADCHGATAIDDASESDEE